MPGYIPKKLAQTYLTATTETTAYTVAGASTAIVKQVIVANVTGSQVLASFSFVPTGGTAADSNRAFKDTPVLANSVMVFDLSQVMATGDFISVKAGTANALVFTISGVEYTSPVVLPSGVEVARNGALSGTRPRVNFVEGANITITAADDAGNNEVDVTVAVSGNLGHVVKDEGTPMTTRAGLNFVGAGVVVTDDAGGNEIEVLIDGGQTDALVFMGGL